MGYYDSRILSIYSRISPIWQGAFLKIFSCACFAMINGLIRALSGGSPLTIENPLSPATLAFFQNLFGTLFLLPLFWHTNLTALIQKHRLLHVVRIITAVLGVYFWYLTLQHMPIAEGVALSFTSPIFTLLIAWFFLRERLNWQRLMAIFLSLIGAFLITRPDQILFNTQKSIGMLAIIPCTSALLLGLNKILTRKLASLGEPVSLLATYLLVFMTPFSLINALLTWTSPLPWQWPWLVLLGALAALAHLSFIKAYALADVTFLTPFSLSKFFLGATVGYLAFGEFPSRWSVLIGSIIILCSILLLGWNKKTSAKISNN